MLIYINFYISGLMGLSDFTLSILLKIFRPDKTRKYKKKRKKTEEASVSDIHRIFDTQKKTWLAYAHASVKIRLKCTRQKVESHGFSSVDLDLQTSLHVFAAEGTISVAKFALGKTIVSAGNPGLCFLI